MKTTSLLCAGFLLPACNGFVPGTALFPQLSMKLGPAPLQSRIKHAVAVAVATSVVVLGVAAVPVALAEDLPPGETAVFKC